MTHETPDAPGRPVAVRPDLVWQEVDDQIVLLDPRTSTYHGITGAGTGLWSMITTGTTRADLVAELVRTYDLDPERASRDVDAFLTELRPFLAS
jgi:hypothetical protein